MDKEKWESIFKILDGIYSDFLLEYPSYKNGKNKKIRTDAERKIRLSIRLANNLIQNNPEVNYLLIGGDSVSDYGQTIIYEEFVKPNYFGDDMSDLLCKIQEKIKFLE